MFEKKLDPYVKAQYGLTLYEFMKEKIEAESLYLYEVAELLNLNVTKVSRLSKHFGIKNKNGFKKRFTVKYGTDAIQKFKTMIEDPEKSLAGVGRYFGFSREYARQVYKKIYGFAYTEIYREKLEEKEKQKPAPKKKSKLYFLRKVMEKMISLGIDAYIFKEGTSYRIASKGFRVDVRISKKPLGVPGREYYRITYKKKYICNCDFVIFVCYTGKNQIHYIIPRKNLPKCGVVFFPKAGLYEYKYEKFREAWGLIKKRYFADRDSYDSRYWAKSHIN